MAKKKRQADENQPQPMPLEALPDRRVLEQLVRQLAGNLEGGRPEETPLDRAQDLIYRAFDAPPTKQVRMARQALEISPDCADAHVLLAENSETVEEALGHFRAGVAAGERALGKKGFEEFEGEFWGFMETRPYMRARQGLAECLSEVGRHEEAAEHYQDMLRLNPNDNQGVRYSLATLLLELEQDEKLTHLLTSYEDDSSADWVYAKTLAAFRREGDCKAAAKLLKQAMNVNKHVPAYLLGNKQLPEELPPYISPGDEDEAVGYVAGNRRVWLNTPGAISWLRKTLGSPMPKAPKPRRPAWSQVRLVLNNIPLLEEEVWQVDAMPLPVSDEQEESPWLVLIADRDNRAIVGFEVVDDDPKPADMLDILANAMRQPTYGDPCRPSKIEVRQKAFQTAWKAKLKQIGVACELVETLDSVDTLRNNLPTLNVPKDAEGQADPEELVSLPIELDEVWQVDVRQLPIWIDGEKEPQRPWAVLVVDHTHDMVLLHDLSPERPSAATLCRTVSQAVQGPMCGPPRRPAIVEVASETYREAMAPYLQQADIECKVSDRLESADRAFESLEEHLGGGQGEPPAISDAPGITPEQMDSFFAAAADYYRRKPWRQVLGDTIIKVECDKFQSGPWYAVVMGQSGVQQGLAIYEDLAALQALMCGNASTEQNARSMSAVSMMFSEAFEISARDLNLIEKHGWTVAGPEAYPMVLHINPGAAVRSPLVWELTLLEGCLRTLPEFLAQKAESLSKTVAVASDTLPVRVSWLPE